MDTHVKFSKLHKEATVPSRVSEFAAGYDLYACVEEKVIIPAHKTVKIGTGMAIQPPHGYFGAIFARSGLATKQGLRLANCVGVCDEDYTGEYIVAIHNDREEVRVVHNGDRVAQLVFLPYLSVEFEEADSLDKTERGSGGFGSTGN